MPENELPLRFCKQPGCPEKTREGYCPAHKHDNVQTAYQKVRSKDPVDRMYQRKPWPNFKAMVLRQNPQCARIHSGVQCPNRSRLVHHLLSPRQRPDLFVIPSNVAALCFDCHTPEEGTPHWRPGVDYVPTKLSIMGEKQ